MTAFENLVRHVDAEETTNHHRARIKRLAETVFADHVITPDEHQPMVFWCARPDTRISSFRVAFLPDGLTVVYGDIGDLLIQRGGFGWLEEAIRHDYVSDYLMGKRLIRRNEFMPGDALAELRRLHDGVPTITQDGGPTADLGLLGCKWDEAPNPQLALSIAEDWLLHSADGRHADAWLTAWYTHSDESEPPRCEDYHSNDLWCYFALCWFVRHYAKVTILPVR